MSLTPDLSEREREILALVATGASNKEIAVRLSISPNTVKVHLRNIFDKIGAVSRTEATVIAMRLGLVPSVSAPDTSEKSERKEAAPTAEPLTSASEKVIPLRLFVLIGAIVLIAVLLAVVFAINPPGVPALAATPTPAPRWQPAAALPQDATGAAGAVYDGSLYIIGGIQSNQSSGALQIYRKGEWTKGATKPHPVLRVSAAAIGELIYVPGGCDAQGKPAVFMDVYDPRQDAWSVRANLPEPRCNYALSAFEGSLYLFGGWDGGKESDSVFRYDPDTDTWHVVSRLTTPLQGAQAVVEGAGIAILGGFRNGEAQTSHRVYFPGREGDGGSPWERRADLPQARTGASAATLAEQFYLVGGLDKNGQPVKDAWQYVSADDQWVPVETPPIDGGAGMLLLPLGGDLHLITGTSHLTYQAVFTVLVPLIP